jgi:glycosyltransferase involved in cell wall biosynthesis
MTIIHKIMRRILYFTLESIKLQPILSSQVIPLLKGLTKDDEFKIDLLTIEPSGISYNVNAIGMIHLKKENYLLILVKRFRYLRSLLQAYDIVHVRGYFPMVVMIMLRKSITAKIIFDMRGILPEEFKLRSDSLKYKIYSLMFQYVERKALAVADRIVVVSRRFRDHVTRKYPALEPDRIHVVRTFGNISHEDLVDFNLRAHYGLDEDSRLFVYSGSMEVWQKFPEIVEIFKMIKRHIKNAHLLVFTRQIEQANRILSTRLPDNAYRTDFVDTQKLNCYIRQCDMGFLLRDRHIVNLVSSPIKFNDYVSAGLPILISKRIGDSEDIVRKYNLGIMVEQINNKAEIDRFVESTISDIESFVNGEKNSDFANAFNDLLSIEKSIANYSKIYKDIVP